MRDAFGGAMFIKLMLLFFILYISFMALALSYTKAFRVKNSIINYIEQNEGYDIVVDEEIRNYVKGVDYYVSSVGPESSADYFGDADVNCSGQGYCIEEVFSDEYRGTYYRVTTFIEIIFPFFGVNVTIPISGETRVVEK